VNRCKYVALIIVTIAEIRVKPIMMQTPSFVENGICSFQNAEIGTIANTISVIVVYALTQYEKSLKTFGLQHVPWTDGSQRACVGLHCRKMTKMDAMANTTCSMTIA
jgi:hypothetical protein